jgi:hypothetical protein
MSQWFDAKLRKGSVEGRYSNLIVAAQVAAVTGEKAKQVLDKGATLTLSYKVENVQESSFR